MTIARSALHKDTTLDVEFPEERKLDMADKYDSSYCPDDEPTIKIQRPTFPSQVVVSEYEDDKRYPGVGMLICLGTGLAFWGYVAYLLFY